MYMEKLSVKKPFTVLVAVIIIIALGAVSLTHLSMDLLPEMSLPYMIVIAPYPGAGPEKVESLVATPLENTLGTVSGVKNVTSQSSDNYAMIQMEFEDGTNLDSAMVKMTSSLNQLKDTLPAEVGTPTIMQISLDMVATMYVAVERDGYDIYQLSDFVDDEIIPYISRQEGVASISTIGLVDKSVVVSLNQDKIDKLNDKILTKTDSALSDAAEKIKEAQEKVDQASEKLNETESGFGKTVSSAIFTKVNAGVQKAGPEIKKNINSTIKELQKLQKQVKNNKPQTDKSLQDSIDAVNTMKNNTDVLVTRQKKLKSELEKAKKDLKKSSKRLQNFVDSNTEDGATDYKAVMDDIAKSYIRTINNNIDDSSKTLVNELKSNINMGNRRINIYGDAMKQDPSYETFNAIVNDMFNNSLGLQTASERYDSISKQVKQAQKTNNSSNKTTNQSGYIDYSKTINGLISALKKTSDNIDTASMSSLIKSTSGLSSNLADVSDFLTKLQKQGVTEETNKQIGNVVTNLNGTQTSVDKLPQMIDGLEGAMAGLTQGQLDAAVGFSTAQIQLTTAKTQLDAAQKQYDKAKEAALKNANADKLISATTLSQLVYAQNFAMPAGYIDDKNDNSWLLKIGEEFGSDKDIASTLIMDNDTIGTIRLQDISDITVIDNAGDSYTKLDGSDSIILSIFKSSAAGTNDVSKACNKAFKEFEKLYPGTHLVNLMDQGNYINMIVESIFTSIGLGALLAIIILAFFLKDVKPTIVVAISIPLSVLLAIVLMYFTGLDLNMMTLSGLSLGIGMLVDNSVVVMENIFRLKNSGLSSARAAVQGAKQMRGAIIASTLTTVCVFLPSVFADGTVRELLYPLALSIGYCLVASLFIALTVVPASCSTIMRNAKPKTHPWFDKVQNAYGRSLKWCLTHKAVPLVVAVGLLGVSVFAVIKTGIVYIPDMTTNEITVDLKTGEELDREESYKVVDEIMTRMLKIDGIETLGIMDQSTMTSFITTANTGNDSYGRYNCHIVAPENTSEEKMKEISEALEKTGEGLDVEMTVSNSGLGDMTQLMGSSGISINIYGKDLEELEKHGKELAKILENEEGLTEVKDGSTEGDPTLHLVIDRDKAMAKGFTVAQIYGEVAKRLQKSVKSTNVTIDGVDMTVSIEDETKPLTKENLLDMEFTADASLTAQMSGADASQSFDMSSMESMASMMNMDGESKDEDKTEESEEKKEEQTVFKLKEFARIEETTSASAIKHENLSTYITVSADTLEGYNTNLISRKLTPKVDEFGKTLPDGYSVEIGGETTQVNDMLIQMVEMAALGLLFIYLIMVAQFQSLLSPFIILFTIPLAFTGGMFGLMIAGQPLSLLSMLGFVILMGTVVNNGIVFVDYANQLRIGGLERHDALVATGVTRMRPILMTALTTILAMTQMIFGTGMASQLGSGMAVVIAGGLTYATLMTLYIVPVIYDIFFKRPPLSVDVGSDIDEVQDDAAEFLAKLRGKTVQA